MSTYAHYRIWTGILRKNIEVCLPEGFESFLADLESTHAGIKRTAPVVHRELLLKAIRMHGEIIGFGVELKDLEWITTEEVPEEIDDMSVYMGFSMTRLLAQNIFLEEGMPKEIPVKIYHHLDLGGG